MMENWFLKSSEKFRNLGSLVNAARLENHMHFVLPVLSETVSLLETARSFLQIVVMESVFKMVHKLSPFDLINHIICRHGVLIAQLKFLTGLFRSKTGYIYLKIALKKANISQHIIKSFFRLTI